MNLIQKVSTFGTAMLCAATLYAASTPENKHNNKNTADSGKNINYDNAITVKGIQDKAYTEASLNMNSSIPMNTTENNDKIKNFSDFVSAFMLEDSYDYENKQSADIDESLVPDYFNDTGLNSKEDSVKISEENTDKLKMLNPDNTAINDSIIGYHFLFDED